MKRVLSVVLVFVLLLSVSACSGGGKADGNTAVWVTYEEAAGTVKNEENREIFTYSYQQPVISSGAKGTAMVNTKLDNATTTFVYGSGGVDALTAQAKVDWREAWFTSYALNRETTVTRIDDVVASFRYADYSFTGGVHGYMAEYGMTFDMVTGAQLTLRDLTQDEWALKEACRQYIIGYLHGEDFPHREGLLPGYMEALETVLNNWVFTGDGLQFIAQPYIIAPYAVGTLRFTVPYGELSQVLDDKWLPEALPQGNGTLAMRGPETGEAAMKNFVIAGGGETLTLQAKDAIWDFSVEEVNSYLSEGELVFYIVQQHLYSPCVRNEVFTLQLPVPEGAPTMLLRYRDGMGAEHQYYVTYNGRDGGVLLATVDQPLTRE